MQDKTIDTAVTAPAPSELFLKYPPEYYHYALQWCSYPHWTIEETANLLTGCVPHREMFIRGPHHAAIDEEVLISENLIRAALHSELSVVKSRKHFGKTYLLSEEIFEWAKQQRILIPKDLLKAEQVIRHQYKGEHYVTPCMEAVDWVVKNFWENANLREPPTSGQIIHALLQQFPELSGAQCDMVEQITRHPVTLND